MDGSIPLPWRVDKSGLNITLRLTPRGGREAIDGIGVMADGRSALLVRVRPAPENGAANHALIKLLAKTVGIPASHVEIVSGHTSRLKSLHLSGDIAAMKLRLMNSTVEP